LVGGEALSVDASLIEADVDKKKRVPCPSEMVLLRVSRALARRRRGLPMPVDRSSQRREQARAAAKRAGRTFQISTPPATAHGPRQETLATLRRAPPGTKRAAAPARVPDRRGGQTSTHRLSTKQQVMSGETPIVELLLGATHVKVYASG
jgi:hypothetical protein